MEWISVKDRLPEIIDRGPRKNPSSLPVLATDGQSIQVSCRWKCGGQIFFLPDYREEIRGITHWMPLPELPKDKI